METNPIKILPCPDDAALNYKHHLFCWILSNSYQYEHVDALLAQLPTLLRSWVISLSCSVRLHLDRSSEGQASTFFKVSIFQKYSHYFQSPENLNLHQVFSCLNFELWKHHRLVWLPSYASEMIRMNLGFLGASWAPGLSYFWWMSQKNKNSLPPFILTFRHFPKTCLCQQFVLITIDSPTTSENIHVNSELQGR